MGLLNTLIDKTTKFYNSIARRYADEIETLLKKNLLGEFINYIGKKSGTIIDLGCGPGRGANYFYNQGFEVVGVDLDLGFLTIARQIVSGGFSFS